jgi:hypothetical protein
MGKLDSQQLFWPCIGFVYGLSFGAIAVGGHVNWSPMLLGFFAIGSIVGGAAVIAMFVRMGIFRHH